MPKKLQLSIPTPCHENWDQMSPADKGRFCDSCRKQVIDFSNMSDRQVAVFFKKPSTGSVCGRFMTEQLERDFEIPRKRIPWLKYFFQFLIPAFLVSVKSSAQGKVKVSETTTPTQKPSCTPIMGTLTAAVYKKKVVGDTMITKTPPKAIVNENLLVLGEIQTRPVRGKQVDTPLTESFRVTGKVVDEKGDPVPGATVLVASSGKSLAADATGNFSLETGKANELLRLEVSSVGYKTESYNYPWVFGFTSAPFITIVLKPENRDLEEVVVKSGLGIKRESYTMGGAIACYNVKFKKEIISTSPAIEENKLILYPNPVQPGTGLHIRFDEPGEGYYRLQLVSQSGQSMMQHDIWIDAEARVLNIEIPRVAAGPYFLVLVNKNSGKKFTGKIVVQ